MTERALVEVVAGILYNKEGAFLLSSRPEGKSYAGYWEFAGGKVEADETLFTALQREFTEELGIQIHHATPWLTRIHNYEYARVHLHFFRIQASAWSGTLKACEKQQFCWQFADQITVTPMLPANEPILNALAIPTHFTGTLEKGFSGHNHNQMSFRLLPLSQNSTPHDAIYMSEQEFKDINLAQLSACTNLWIISHQNSDIWAEKAQAIIWPLSSAEDEQALFKLLQQGSQLPILVLADAVTITHHCHQWYAQGIHGVIEDSTLLTKN